MDEAGDSSFPNWPEFRRLFAYDNLIGKVLQGRYEIVRRLGAGGMGVVFLARHIHLDKHFALKIISPRFLDDPEIGERFLLEARAASKIDHPNVVSITDFGVPEEGPAFFAMEHLEGEDLAKMLSREGRLPWPRALPIVAQIARALGAAHQRGVVHRDIKPQNCFRVTRDDNPDFIKVLDFGLAKVLSGTHSAWTVGGSPGYIAPEIYRGGKVDHRVDIFALGVLLHTLLLGRLPAQAPDDASDPIHASDLPAPLQRLIRDATHDDAAQRLPTTDAFLAALEATRAALATPNAPVPADMVKRTGTARLWFAGAALITGVGVTIALASGWPARPDESVAQRETGPPATAPVTVPAPAPATVTATVPATSPETVPATSPVPPADPSAPVIPEPAPATTPAPSKPAPSDSSPRKPPRPFDEPAAREVLRRSAGKIAACKADSSFAGMATTVRLTGSVRVDARGRATVVLPPGYDVSACIERVVAGLRFRPSPDGGEFTQVFLL